MSIIIKKGDKKMRKKILSILGVLILMISSQATAVATQYPVTIQNYSYSKELNEQTYQQAPERVLAVYQSSIETLLALGLEDHIIGVAGLDHEVKPELEDAMEKVNVLTDYEPDKETVLDLNPDMILSWYYFFNEDLMGEVDFWNDRGIHTYMNSNSVARGATKVRTVQNEYDDILNLGKIFDVEDKANQIVEDMQQEIDKVVKNATDEKQSVLIIEQAGDNIRLYGKDTLAGDMVRLLGAEGISQKQSQIGIEDIIKFDPDVIFSVYFLEDNQEEGEKAAIEAFTLNPALKNISAVENNRVYAIPLGEVYCSGIRTLDGIKRLATGIYPQADE